VQHVKVALLNPLADATRRLPSEVEPSNRSVVRNRNWTATINDIVRQYALAVERGEHTDLMPLADQAFG
jgi:hypothetical protein